MGVCAGESGGGVLGEERVGIGVGQSGVLHLSDDGETARPPDGWMNEGYSDSSI